MSEGDGCFGADTSFAGSSDEECFTKDLGGETMDDG